MYMCVCVYTCVYIIMQGHFKVVKFLVDHVSQFPSDAELTRYISTLSDKVHVHVCVHVHVYTCTCVYCLYICACSTSIQLDVHARLELCGAHRFESCQSFTALPASFSVHVHVQCTCSMLIFFLFLCMCMLQEILKKCQRCMEVIIDAKERQAAEANKNATILLQEIDQEKVLVIFHFYVS